MTRFFTITFFLIFHISAHSQDTNEVNLKVDTISTWLEDTINKYSGFYAFGNGEEESDLRIIITKEIIVAQIMNGYWENETDEWKWNYRNLSNVKIDSLGNFSSDKYSGKFITYQDGNFIEKGLKIENHWLPSNENTSEEVGRKIETPFGIHHGKYTFASLKITEKKELRKFNLSELEIIRNEIYARYGFKFEKDSELKNYFLNQNWYNPQHNNVDEFLTEIEKINIIKILKQERIKK